MKFCVLVKNREFMIIVFFFVKYFVFIKSRVYSDYCVLVEYCLYWYLYCVFAKHYVFLSSCIFV